MPEGPRKVVSAQASNGCHEIKGEIALQVRFNVIQHTLEPAAIQRSSCVREHGLAVRRSDALLNQPRRQTGGEALNKQTAGGGFGL